MNTITKLTLIRITTALLTTGGAYAEATEWATFDNHHGSITYFRRAQKETTVGVSAQGKGIGRANGKIKSGELRLNKLTTAHGSVSYFAPVE